MCTSRQEALQLPLHYPAAVSRKSQCRIIASAMHSLRRDETEQMISLPSETSMPFVVHSNREASSLPLARLILTAHFI